MHLRIANKIKIIEFRINPPIASKGKEEVKVVAATFKKVRTLFLLKTVTIQRNIKNPLKTWLMEWTPRWTLLIDIPIGMVGKRTGITKARKKYLILGGLSMVRHQVSYTW